MSENKTRYLHEPVSSDLGEKMVFIGGPRQVGKTTFALSLLENQANEKHPAYLNWDIPSSRPTLLRGDLPPEQPLVILDEIHKFARWRNLVKGLYDGNRSTRSFLVTGSARLDYYRKGGDSLQGRYHYYRLHPFTLFELNNNPTSADIELLLRYGVFPEPLLKGQDGFWRRWQR